MHLSLLLCCTLVACAAGARIEIKPKLNPGDPGGWRHGFVALNNDRETFTFHEGTPNDAEAYPAVGNFSAAPLHKSNFAQLRISTSERFPDHVQAQAAGYLEAYITADQIFDYWYNMRWWITTKVNDSFKIQDWIVQNHAWITEQVAANAHDTYWQGVGLVVAQVQGLFLGYNARVTHDGAASPLDHISFPEFLVLNTLGDMDDLLTLLFPEQQLVVARWAQLPDDAFDAELHSRGRCSVLVKVAADLSDVYIGHSTWWTYASMVRVYKHVRLAFTLPGVRAHAFSMSSYPGMVTSMDDFYILDSGLVVTETSNDVFNKDLWALATHQAALSWHRVRVANTFARDGAEWAALLSRHNSGTYNNQYIVLDLNRFRPRSELQAGLLTIVEQIPGLVVHADRTQDLERGYWPSYNVPYFRQVYDASGYPQLQAARREHAERQPGDANANYTVTGLSYQLAPRAQIFRRDAGFVSGWASFKELMRANNFSQGDALAGRSPWHAICARGDLSATHPKASGCNDAKVTSYRRALRLEAEAVSGPSTAQGRLPPFSWSQFPTFARRGQPDTFDFDWEVQQP